MKLLNKLKFSLIFFEDARLFTNNPVICSHENIDFPRARIDSDAFFRSVNGCERTYEL